MQTSMEVDRALGRYRASWHLLLSVSMVCVLFLGPPVVDLIGGQPAAGDVVRLLLWGALLATFWLVPETIVSMRGIRLVWRFRFIPWSQVSRVYWSTPRNPDLLIGLTDGTRLRVSRVPGDRLPGVLVLARRAGSTSGAPGPTPTGST